MPVTTETRGRAAVSWLASPHHRYEDRYRLLPRDIPLVRAANKGEVFAVFDGVGSAPMGMAAAQTMSDCLVRYFKESDANLVDLLTSANQQIHEWGFIDSSNSTLGACAGTVAWLHDGELTILHAGDTTALLLGAEGKPRVLTTPHEHQGSIFNYFGRGRDLELEQVCIGVSEDDVILMVTDGVTKAFRPVDAGLLAQSIHGQSGDAARAVSELVNRARRKGSSDDITAIMFEALDPEFTDH